MRQRPHRPCIGNDPLGDGRVFDLGRVVDGLVALALALAVAVAALKRLGTLVGRHRTGPVRVRGRARRRPTLTKNQPIARWELARRACRLDRDDAWTTAVSGGGEGSVHDRRSAAVRRSSVIRSLAIISASAGFNTSAPLTRSLVTRVVVTRVLVNRRGRGRTRSAITPVVPRQRFGENAGDGAPRAGVPDAVRRRAEPR